jgi:uncharacterized LabA/DUF88 family protein
VSLLGGKNVSYYAVSDTPTYKEIGFINYLEKTGYNVVKSLKKQLPDGRFKNKGDDVQIATDIAINANENDHIILVSGDGDFTYSLQKVKAKGCQVTVVSTANCLSSQLKNVADNVINLTDLKSKIKRQDTVKSDHKPTLKRDLTKVS